MTTTLINLNNTTPAAPGGGINVLWQSDSSTPINVSAYVNLASFINILPGQVAFGDAGTNTIKGSTNFTFDDTLTIAIASGQLSITAPANTPLPMVFGPFLDNSTLFEGLQIISAYDGSVTNPTASHTGLSTNVQSGATGGVYGLLVGHHISMDLASSAGGTITDVYGLNAEINSGTAAAQTNYTAVRAAFLGTQDATTGYAFRAPTMLGGAATNLWGIYVDNAPNFLGGNTQTSGLSQSIVTKTGNYTTTVNDHTILTNSSGAVTITLLTSQPGGPFVGLYPATFPVGQTYQVVNINTGTTTVQGQTGNINGKSAFVVAPGSAARFQWDGTNWWVLSEVEEPVAVNLTAQTANIGATTLYAVPSYGAGLYRVSAYVVETTAGSVSSTLPNVQIVFTDPDTGGAITIDATPILAGAGLGQTGALTANTVGTTASGVIVIAAKASTNIQYQTVNYASNAAGMAYSLRIRLEAL